MIGAIALSAAIAIEAGAHIGTWHQQPGYRDVNPGLFVAATAEDDRFPDHWRTGLAGGVYANSIGKTSVWFGSIVRTREFYPAHGVSVYGQATIGFVNGYGPKVQAMVLPSVGVTYEKITTHFTYLPKADPKGTNAVNLSVSKQFWSF